MARRHFCVSKFVHGGKNPGRFHENQRGHPRAFTHECLRGRNLLAVVARDQADQDIRVNGAHVFSSWCVARLCRTLLLSSERVSPGERSLGEYLLRYTGQLCARLPHRLPRPTPGPSRGRYRVFVALPLEQIFDPER